MTHRGSQDARRTAAAVARATLTALALADGGLTAARAQDAAALLYVPITPCRLIDTRAAGGVVTPGADRTFDLVGVETPGSLAGQGGNPAGCPIPGFGAGGAVVEAVAINLVAVQSSGAGHLTVWPTDQPKPLASALNFASSAALAGLNVANGLILPVRTDVEGDDVTVSAGVSSTHLVADALGYFTATRRRRYYLTTTTANGAGADNQCADGFHFASLWEIFDTTQLEYDTSRGDTDPDSGAGPPASAPGWVRTGNVSYRTTGVVGSDNCFSWIDSAGTSSGTTVKPVVDWTAAATAASPWLAASADCDQLRRSWCVED